MGCGTPIVLSSPYNYCSFSINNVSAELIKIFPLNPNSIISISTKEYKIIDLSKEKEGEKVLFEEEIFTAIITERKDGLKLIEGTINGNIIIEDLETDKINELEGHESTITCLLMLKNGKLCSCSADGQVIIWNINKKKELYNFYPHEKIIWNIIELNDERLFSVSEDNSAKIFSYKNEVKLEISFNTNKSKCNLQLKDGRIVFNSNKDILIYQLDKLPNINIPDRAKNKFKPEFIIKDSHNFCVSCIIQLNNGDLCSGSEDGSIKLWSLNNNFQNIMELSGHKSKINDIVENNIGKLFTCSDDRSIKVWIQ